MYVLKLDCYHHKIKPVDSKEPCIKQNSYKDCVVLENGNQLTFYHLYNFHRKQNKLYLCIDFCCGKIKLPASNNTYSQNNPTLKDAKSLGYNHTPIKLNSPVPTLSAK